LEAAAKEKNLTAGEWSRTDDKELASAYESKKTEVTSVVVSWFTSLSDDVLDKTLAAFNSMTEYLSMDNML
jgi:hypothetical protein